MALQFFEYISKNSMLVLFLILMVFPFLTSSKFVATDILIWGLFALGFNILLGQTGIGSFGHAAYFGLGSYGAALWLMRPYGVRTIIPLWLGWGALVSGTGLAVLAALFVGLLGLRRTGHYFALIALAFAQMFYFIFYQNPGGITGGGDGIVNIPTPPILWIDGVVWRTPLTWYYFVMIVVLIAIFVIRKISNSHFGQVLKGIRENEQRISLLGYNVWRYRLASFMISGLFSGFAGSLYALHLNYVGLENLTWLVSGDVFLMTLLGGRGAFFGPLLGAALYIWMKDFFASVTDHWMIPLGIVVVAVIWSYRGKGVYEIIKEQLLKI
ncbi:MAG: branched-chain amino acid ABC transporter permease [Candidatus Bathyarchaeia archaeon]